MSVLPDQDPPSRLTGDSSVGAVIAAFAKSADPALERRELRAALSHIAAELGTMPIRAVRARHVVGLLDDLRDEGLSPRRETAVVDALGSLFAFAVARRLIAVSPVTEPARPERHQRPRPERHHRPRPRAAAPAPPEETHTPTLTMLALGARVAWWTALIVTLGFATLLLVLVVELA
jgi:hypothetical protein